jgi:hypothetical protein
MLDRRQAAAIMDTGTRRLARSFAERHPDGNGHGRVEHRGTRRRSGHALGSPTQCTKHFPLSISLRHVLPLVVGLLAARKSKLHLDFSFEEIQRQRNEREVTVLDFAYERVDLATVQQKLSVATRLVVGPRAVVIFGNVQVTQPDFAVVDGCVGVGQRRLTVPQAFNFSAEQNYPGLEHVQDRIVVSGLAIGCQDLPSWLRFVGRLFGHRYRRTYRRNVAYEVTPDITTPNNSSNGAM